jgi:hypothetical protein
MDLYAAAPDKKGRTQAPGGKARPFPSSSHRVPDVGFEWADDCIPMHRVF